MLKIFLTKDFPVGDLLCDAPSCSQACLFFSNDLLCLWLHYVQYDLRYDFAWVADEADRSVVLVPLRVVFFGKCDDQGLGPQGWPFSCLPNLVVGCSDSTLHLLGLVLLGCCRLQLTFLSSPIVLQPPLLCEGWGGRPLCVSRDSSVLMDLRLSCDCTAQSSILSIGSVSVALL